MDHLPMSYAPPRQSLWIARAYVLDYRLREIPVPALHPSEED